MKRFYFSASILIVIIFIIVEVIERPVVLKALFFEAEGPIYISICQLRPSVFDRAIGLVRMFVTLTLWI